MIRLGQLAVVMLALFGQMERTYSLERTAHARAVATAKGRRVGRPSVVDPDKLSDAEHLCASGYTMAEIVTKTGITRTSLYRYLPPRPVASLVAQRPQLAPAKYTALRQSRGCARPVAAGSCSLLISKEVDG